MEVNITQANAMKAYNMADGPIKKVLEALLGRSLNDVPMKCVNSFEDLCAYAGEDVETYAIPASGTHKQLADAYWEVLMLAERVFNGDWRADVADTTQKKWSVWANVTADRYAPFGFRLSYYDYVCVYVSSRLGARPEFKEQAIAIHVFKILNHYYAGHLFHSQKAKHENK